ncbi:MAG TPA: hypothetical protein VHO47_00380 [Candidatus Babeliales bacterium]|nr:hypothetical protein [Candidatus Babeliales bacterium]
MKLQSKVILVLIGIHLPMHAMEKKGNNSTPPPELFFQKKYPISWGVPRKKQKTETDQQNILIDATIAFAKELKTINKDCKKLTNGAQEICTSFAPFIPEMQTDDLRKFALSANRIYNSACVKYRTDIEIINLKLPTNYKLDENQMNEKIGAYAAELKKKMLDPYISELKHRGVPLDTDSTN